jgi:hypothetical protein
VTARLARIYGARFLSREGTDSARMAGKVSGEMSGKMSGKVLHLPKETPELSIPEMAARLSIHRDASAVSISNSQPPTHARAGEKNDAERATGCTHLWHQLAHSKGGYLRTSRAGSLRP